MAPLTDDPLEKARILARQGATAQAKQLYKILLESEPANQRAQDELAALERRSEQFSALSQLLQQGDHAAVLAKAEVLEKEYPDSVFLLNIIAVAHAALKQFEPAIARYTKAIEIRPDIAAFHNGLGKVLSEASCQDEAIASFGRALTINPQFTDAYYSLGIALRAVGRHDEAVASVARSVQLEPNSAEMIHHYGAALCDAGRYQEALAPLRRALQIAPGVIGTHIYLSIALNKLGRYSEDLVCLNEILKIDPTVADVRGQKLFLQAMMCDWASRGEDAEMFPTLGIEGAVLRPFVMLSLEDNPARHKSRSENFARQRYNQPEFPPIAVPAVRPERLRIGYFSADFNDHPTMYLLVRLLELHDRTQFQVYAYSYGPPAQDPMRARAEAAVDVYRDVHHLGAAEIAKLAREDGIDIAVDLMGYTKNARTEIFARRPAPVQINYLGYPGTMGAPFIDYIIADKTLIPPEQRMHFCEKIIYMPNSYQATDNRREVSARAVTRAEMGLPENGFVFCCFNNSFKISPAEFDVWMRLLEKVEGSVLWLLNSNPWFEPNLRREAQKRNIDPERLEFAQRVPTSDHLARHRLADLFLDTFNYNAHSTASDALWSGLPVVTKVGQGFASRVGASLLNAIGLAELITGSEEEYERLALELALNPAKLGELKAKLSEHRLKKPLFDSEKFAKHIEQAYRQIYGRYIDGKTPEDIEIAAN